MSQVKNLRAMFENKGDSVSPPERGRTLTPSSSAESSKPLSKVRTNFIAIEKDGRVGLQRDHSGESSVSRRRLSNETTEGAETVATSVPEKPESVTAIDEPIKSILAEPAVPAPTPFITHTNADTARSAPIAAQATSPRKIAPEPKTEEGPKVTPAIAAVNGHTSAAPKSPRKETRDTPTKQDTEVKASGRSTNLTISSVSRGSTRSGAKSPSVTKQPLASPSLREPRAAKPPLSPVAIAPKKTTAAFTPSKPASAPSSQKPTPSSAARRPPPIHVSPSNNLTSGIGFIKPKPRSPTKPIKLPASLMAQTTASGSKINPTRLSTGSASGSQTALPRSASRASTSTTTSTLKRQTSTVGGPRPSVGPPPKKTTQERPAPKKEKQVDEGFLARMMRPTQSSQSKTSDKAPVTPPRKAPDKRAPTRQSERSESRVRRTSSTRRLASRSVSPSRTTTPGSATKESTPAEPITEEMITAAKEAAMKTNPTKPAILAEATRPVDVPDIKDSEELAQQSPIPTEESQEISEPISEPTAEDGGPDSIKPQVSDEPSKNPDLSPEASFEVTSTAHHDVLDATALDEPKETVASPEPDTPEKAPATDIGVETADDVSSPSAEETW